MAVYSLFSRCDDSGKNINLVITNMTELYTNGMTELYTNKNSTPRLYVSSTGKKFQINKIQTQSFFSTAE